MPKSFNDAVAKVKATRRKDGKRFSLWLSRAPYEKFQRMCEQNGVSAAEIIDEWVAEAVAEAAKKR